MQTVQTMLVAVAIGILLAVAYSDVRRRRIPNALTAATAILGLAQLIVAGDLVAAAHTLIASAAVFATAFMLFWRGVFGGGDAKLMTAMALLIGSHNLFDFLVIMSVCGGGLGLGILAWDGFHTWRRPTSEHLAGPPTLLWAEPAPPPAKPTVPYGVAIAGAGVVMLILRPVL
jgi:prepilin peptidase CpaA